MNKLLLLTITFVFTQVSFGQDLDNATLNKLRVKLINVESLYTEGNIKKRL